MGLHGCGHTAHEEIMLRNALSTVLGARAVCQCGCSGQLVVGLAQTPKCPSRAVGVESVVTESQKSAHNTHKHNKVALRARKI